MYYSKISCSFYDVVTTDDPLDLICAEVTVTPRLSGFYYFLFTNHASQVPL